MRDAERAQTQEVSRSAGVQEDPGGMPLQYFPFHFDRLLCGLDRDQRTPHGDVGARQILGFLLGIDGTMAAWLDDVEQAQGYVATDGFIDRPQGSVDRPSRAVDADHDGRRR